MQIELVPIFTVCKIGSGKTPSRAQADIYYGEGVAWIKSGELKSNKILSSEECITKKAVKDFSMEIVPAEAVLLAMYGATAGQVAILGIPAATNQAVCYLIPEPTKLDRDYLFFVLRSKLTEFLGKRVGGGQPNISQGIISKTKIKLPPLQEQKRISKILSRVDALRQKYNEAQRLMMNLAPAVFEEMFGNKAHSDSIPFGELVAFNQLGLVRGAKDMNEDFAYDYLRMNSLRETGGLNLNGLKKVNATKAEVEQYSIQKGDFLFNTRNSRSLVGKSAIVPEMNKILLFNNNLMRIRFKPGILPQYVASYFQTPVLKGELEKRKSGTTSVVAIYYKDLANLPILLPSLELQRRFVKKLEKIRELMKQTEVRKLAIEELCATVSERYFS